MPSLSCLPARPCKRVATACALTVDLKVSTKQALQYQLNSLDTLRQQVSCETDFKWIYLNASTASFFFFFFMVSCWSMSLDNTMIRHTEKSTKHWFSIYQMLEKHMQERTEEQEGKAGDLLQGLENQPCHKVLPFCVPRN